MPEIPPNNVCPYPSRPLQQEMERPVRRRSDRLLPEQERMLALIASDAPIVECFRALIDTVSRLHPTAAPAIVLIKTPDYNPGSGAWGMPVHLSDLVRCTFGPMLIENETLTSADLSTDARWTDGWREHCLAHGIRATHLTRISDHSGNAIGSFVLCFRDAHDPDVWEVSLGQFGAYLTNIAIERERMREALGRTDTWLTGQKEAFQAAVKGAPIEVSLGFLIRAALARSDPLTRYAFYITNPEQNQLYHITGMPDAYARAVNGLEIGRILAAQAFESDVTVDRSLDPSWTQWRRVAEEFGYRTCWSFPIETAEGKVVGTFAVYHPVSRRMSTEDQDLASVMTRAGAIIISQHQEAQARRETAIALQKNEARLQAADRQKNEFLAMLAHEMRNPLAPILNASEVLARTSGADVPARHAIGVIQRQTAHLTRLVDDLFDVARITQGRIQLQTASLDLKNVISQALEALEPQLKAKRHVVNLVSSDEPLYVTGDLARLVQCVGNLLSNAAKYTDPGGKIRLRTRADDSCVHIEIADNGVGIPVEVLPRVFDLFVQNDRTLDRAQGGLEIGLAVVKRLVEMHGGEISASSGGVGRGSTFEIRLPRLARPQVNEDAPMIAAAMPRRVLIVDDNRDAADSLSMLMRGEGHTTKVTYSSQEALGCVQSFRPEVAFLDIGLPHIDGYQLAQRLRSVPQLQGIRLVALTGYCQPEDRAHARAAGFDDHLAKPVSFEAIQHALALPGPPGR
jgi:signal transduction histidine kinase